jgi:hypothetical protein
MEVVIRIGAAAVTAIGNVGMRPETNGWVDHVVTPVGAFGFMVAEGALDRYFVQWSSSASSCSRSRPRIRTIHPGNCRPSGAAVRPCVCQNFTL